MTSLLVIAPYLQKLRNEMPPTLEWRERLWHTKRGESLPLCEIDDDHLMNIGRLMYRIFLERGGDDDAFVSFGFDDDGGWGGPFYYDLDPTLAWSYDWLLSLAFEVIYRYDHPTARRPRGQQRFVVNRRKALK